MVVGVSDLRDNRTGTLFVGYRRDVVLVVGVSDLRDKRVGTFLVGCHRDVVVVVAGERSVTTHFFVVCRVNVIGDVDVSDFTGEPSGNISVWCQHSFL